AHGRAVLAPGQKAQLTARRRYRVACERLRRQPLADELRDLARTLARALTWRIRRHALADHALESVDRLLRVEQRRPEPAFADLAVADLAHLLVQRSALAARVVVRTIALRARHEQSCDQQRPHAGGAAATD